VTGVTALSKKFTENKIGSFFARGPFRRSSHMVTLEYGIRPEAASDGNFLV